MVLIFVVGGANLLFRGEYESAESEELLGFLDMSKNVKHNIIPNPYLVGALRIGLLEKVDVHLRTVGVGIVLKHFHLWPKGKVVLVVQARLVDLVVREGRVVGAPALVVQLQAWHLEAQVRLHLLLLLVGWVTWSGPWAGPRAGPRSRGWPRAWPRTPAHATEPGLEAEVLSVVVLFVLEKDFNN